jgi:2,7-dihydroxy-5-methyl-1-naphthoate 7-O-methyltransferase
MPQQAVPNIWDLIDMCTPWCVHVVATLRVADHIAAGVSQVDPLARAAGADAESLRRVLRHLVGRGLFEEPSPGSFALNEPARALLSMSPGLDLNGIGGRMAYAWGSLLEAVKIGMPAYHTVFGRPFWDDLAAHPEVAASFDALMGPGHGPADPDVLIGGWDNVQSVVDVGGGTGSLLAAVLRAHPKARGTLVDLPSTVARAAETFASAGVRERVRSVGQSFFDPLPTGGDVYLLKKVLCDWPDREALAILKRCAEAARPAGRVVVVGGISPDGGGGPSPELLMMVLVGGKQRTLSEFRVLAQKAGLETSATGKRPSGTFIVECRTNG